MGSSGISLATAELPKKNVDLVRKAASDVRHIFSSWTIRSQMRTNSGVRLNWDVRNQNLNSVGWTFPWSAVIATIHVFKTVSCRVNVIDLTGEHVCIFIHLKQTLVYTQYNSFKVQKCCFVYCWCSERPFCFDTMSWTRGWGDLYDFTSRNSEMKSHFLCRTLAKGVLRHDVKWSKTILPVINQSLSTIRKINNSFAMQCSLLSVRLGC